MEPQFAHNCTADRLVAVIQDDSCHCDIYTQCSGRGYIVRYGDGGPEYTSSFQWTFGQALKEALFWTKS